MADIAKETRHPLEDFEISDQRSSAKSWAQAYDGEGSKERAGAEHPGAENSSDRNSNFLSEHIAKLQGLTRDDREAFLRSLLSNPGTTDKIAATQEKFQNLLHSADSDTSIRQVDSGEAGQLGSNSGALERQHSNPLQNKFLERELSLAAMVFSQLDPLSENVIEAARQASRAASQIGDQLEDLSKITGRQELLKTNFQANCLNDTKFGARSKFLSAMSEQ